MERIRQKDLEYCVERINKITNSPITAYTQNKSKSSALAGVLPDSPSPWNIGNYYLDYAYGGVKLVRVISEGGGIEVISTGGYGTKRELYSWMNAFLAGISI